MPPAAQTRPQAAAPPIQAPKPRPSSAGEKVIVACKFPNGMVLKVHRWEDVKVAKPGGYDIVREARPDGDPVSVHGWRAPKGEVPPAPVIGGYALTYGISKEFWDQWLSENKDQAFVTSKIIYAFPDRDHAEGWAKENRTVTSGLEPLNMARTKAPGARPGKVFVDRRVAMETPRIRERRRDERDDAGDDD